MHVSLGYAIIDTQSAFLLRIRRKYPSNAASLCGSSNITLYCINILIPVTVGSHDEVPMTRRARLSGLLACRESVLVASVASAETENYRIKISV